MKTKRSVMSTLLISYTLFSVGCKNADTDNETTHVSRTLVSRNESAEYAPRNTQVFASLSPTAENAGFLLGLRQNGQYRTLYITFENGEARINFDLPHVVSIQEEDVWFLGTQSFGYGRNCPGLECQFNITEIWAGKTPLVPKSSQRRRKGAHESLLAQFEHPYFTEYSWTEKIEYVANNAVCASTSASGFNEENEGFQENEHHCVLLRSNIELDRPLSPRGMVTAQEIRAIKAQLQSRLHAAKFEEVPMRKLKPSELEQIVSTAQREISFQLTHREGLTWLIGQLSIKVPKDISNSGKLTINGDAKTAGPQLVRANNFSTKISRLRAIDHTILDAFESPAHNIIFFLTHDRLIGINPKTWDEKLNQPVRWQTVIMADWSIGPQVSEWKQQFAAALR